MRARCCSRPRLAFEPSLRNRRPSAPTSLDEFLELSQRLLGRSKLDPEIAQIYLNALLADADTAVYLATLVQSNGNPTPEQSAVASTIIEWWYTGVYTIEGQATPRHSHRRVDVVRARPPGARDLRRAIRRVVAPA